jgi:2,3-bisphosphoglycerate-independent phosphoglycerate mutase
MNTSSSHGGHLLAEAVEKAYQAGQTDYGMEPLVRVDASGGPLGLVHKGDAVIFCCRRGEREVELTEAFSEREFSHFSRPDLDPLDFVILTLYHEKFKDLKVAFAPTKIQDTLTVTVSRAGLKQLHISESEKFAHVTFFLNGGNNQPFAGENDIRIPSPKGIPFDQIPELSLPKVADAVINGLHQGVDLIVTNFANGDVIGHTANNAVKFMCAEAVDFHLGRVVREAVAQNYVIAITADHGNLEETVTAEGKPHVSHTTNPVPFILLDPAQTSPFSVLNGSLQDIAPTLLNILGVSTPAAMTGTNLAPGVHWGAGRHALLIILDGWGIGKEDESNPIHAAATVHWDALIQQHAHSELHASGEAVGLQQGKTGNSEAGHLNIGAGRVVLQDDVRLDQAMQDGSFFTNEIFLETIEGVKDRRSSLHLIGLLTEKSSHGSIEYPLALLKLAKDSGLDSVYLHLIFDGRSTEPGSAPALLQDLEQRIAAIGVGQIVTGIGRGVALDRDGNYEKIKRAFEAMVLGKGMSYPEGEKS